MIIDLTTKEVRKVNGFVKVKKDAPDGRFAQDWEEGGISYKSAIFEAKKTPELITTIIDEKKLNPNLSQGGNRDE